MTFELRPMSPIRRGVLRYEKVIFLCKLKIVVAKAIIFKGLNLLFHFIFIPIYISKIK